MAHEIEYTNPHEATIQMIEWDRKEIDYICYSVDNITILVFLGYKQGE